MASLRETSTTYSHYIRNAPIEDEVKMVSFEVNLLYILITDILNIIKNYVNNNEQYTSKTALPQNKFFDLVNLISTTTWYI